MSFKPEFRSWAVQYGDVMPSFCCTGTPKLPQDTEVILRLLNDFPCGNPTSPKLDFVRRFLLQYRGKSPQNPRHRAFADRFNFGIQAEREFTLAGLKPGPPKSVEIRHAYVAPISCLEVA